MLGGSHGELPRNFVERERETDGALILKQYLWERTELVYYVSL